MKISAVYDNDGRILMGIIDDGKYDSPRPVPDKKTYGGTFEVPATDDKLSLEEICTTFRVDRTANRLMRGKG